ncbi:MAG: PAS domain S-box protein, partial [Bacteroidales bacterium]|nr:PAS domain S-box protein [Bacteroidales bacterium]
MDKTEEELLRELKELKQAYNSLKAAIETDLLSADNTEKESKMNQIHFHLLFNEMPLGYQSLDFDGYFIEVNQEWLNILGYSRDEVIGKCFSDFLTPIYRDAFSKRFPIFKEKGTIYSEFEMIHKNGTVIFVGFNGKIAYDLNGNFKYTHCFLQDITQSKNAEKALRVSEEKMRSIYSVAPAGIGVVCDRVLKDVNSRVCEMTGYSMEELIDKNARLLYPSQTEFDFVGEEKYNQIREKGTGAVETLWQRKDGSIINVLVSSTPIDRNDYSKGLIFTALDITKRKKAEEDLKETKRLLSESEKLGKVGGWEFNIDTFDQKWTDETFFIHDVDISFDNTIDKGINFYTQESKPIIINAVERAIEFGEPFDLELDIITAKGNLKHVHTIGKADIENRRLFGFFQDITERKNAEEKLNQSMKSYQAIYNSSTDCIFIHDSKTGEIVDVNQTTIDTFGYSREEITQLNVGDFSINIPPYTQKEALEFIQKAVKEGPQFFDWQAKKKNGEIIWLENSLQYIELAGIHRVLVVGRDITERKIIENELNEKTSFLSTIMETSPVGIVTVDKKGNITFANNRAEQILGLAKEKITSTTYDAPLWNHTDVDGSPLPYEKQPFNIVKKTLKTVVDIQHGITWPDGRVVILTINASPILDDRGAFNGMIASIGDITEHKWAEKSLKESEEKYRTLVNSTLQGVIIAKSDPVRLVFANPAMAEICGYSPEELIDMTAGDLTHLVFEEDRPRFFSNFQKRLKGESIAKINEYRLVTKTGVIKWVALYSSVIEYQNEPATLSTFMDVTERKETEEALRRSEKQSAFLAQSAVELVELNSLQEIYKYTVQKLYDLFDGNTIVALVENNNTENRWKMRQVVGLNQNAAAVSKLIGFDINNLEGEISTKYYDKIISGNLTELELDFPGLFNKRLSDAVGKTVKKMFSIEKLYCIAFKQDQNIIGNITFTTNKKTGVVNAQLIEAFIHLVSTVVRKQKAEAKIHEKENEFKKLSANLPDLIYQFTRRPDGSYYVPIASQGITNIFGCQPEDVADNFDAIARVLHPDDVERVITDIEYSAKHLTFFTCEFRVVIPGKPVQWIFSRSTPEKLPDGSITWYGFNANITEYKKTEEELRESKNLFQQISIISKTGGWSVDMITGEHNWTELTREIHEVDPDFVPNMDQAINFYKEGENRKKIADAVSNCVETGEPFDVEVELVTAKGNERWVRSIGSAEYIDGKCVKLIGSIQDISERKKAEEALIESENRFKKLSSFTFEGIIIHNKGIVIDVNQSTLKMLGYKRDEMVGTNLLNAVHPDSHAIVKGNIVKEVAIPYQIVAIREDGSTFDAEIEARYILFNNEFFRVACIRDITERKRSEKIRQLQYNIARATITTRNLQELFDFVKNELNNIIDAKNLFIALYNEETGMIYSPLFKDEKDNYHEWPAEKSTTGYVIKSGQTVHLRREDTLKLVEEGLINIVGSPSEAWLGVPLKVEGKVFGAIVVQSYENPDIFDQTTIE